MCACVCVCREKCRALRHHDFCFNNKPDEVFGGQCTLGLAATACPLCIHTGLFGLFRVSSRSVYVCMCVCMCVCVCVCVPKPRGYKVIPPDFSTVIPVTCLPALEVLTSLTTALSYRPWASELPFRRSPWQALDRGLPGVPFCTLSSCVPRVRAGGGVPQRGGGLTSESHSGGFAAASTLSFAPDQTCRACTFGLVVVCFSIHLGTLLHSVIIGVPISPDVSRFPRPPWRRQLAAVQ